MAYVKTVWVDLSPPYVTADNLNHMETGIKDAHDAIAIINASGTTASRPTPAYVGQQYFDATLGKPIWCKQCTVPVIWVDAAGTTV